MAAERIAEQGLKLLNEIAAEAWSLEVLQWAAAGKTNVEIGAILDMSPRTVEKHFEHVFEKLGVETRMGAVMRPPAGSPQR
jgi:DNA-binding NarL/FixJ family response regulator